MASIFISSCFPARAIYLATPDEKDPYRRPSNTISASETPFHFHHSEKDWGPTLKINDWTNRIPFFRPIEEILKDHHNNAFLIIRNDTILFERYEESVHTKSTSYSIAKSFTSALIGIAIEENLINSVQDRVIDYIPELKDQPKSEFLTIEHLLNQTSGIQFMAMNDATIYYGDNILKSLKRIKFAHQPGTKQHYLKMNTQLLGLILTRVTGQTVSQYLQAKIWQPIGMESDAFWNTDKKNKLEKTFCCLNATARDYAKLGRLYSNNGNWNGQQIVAEKWVQQSIKRDTMQGSSHGYNYSWHIGLKEYDEFLAEGLFAQFVYVCRKKNIIIVALNDREKMIKMNRLQWKYVIHQLVDIL